MHPSARSGQRPKGGNTAAGSSAATAGPYNPVNSGRCADDSGAPRRRLRQNAVTRDGRAPGAGAGREPVSGVIGPVFRSPAVIRRPTGFRLSPECPGGKACSPRGRGDDRRSSADQLRSAGACHVERAAGQGRSLSPFLTGIRRARIPGARQATCEELPAWKARSTACSMRPSTRAWQPMGSRS